MGEERRDRPRRVNALLSSYYSIEGSAQKEASTKERVCADLDRQGFDAKRYFDGIVTSGRLPDLVKRSSDLDAEVKDLDTQMQKLVYENYTQFTRAAGVISKMKVCIDRFEPDMLELEGSLGRLSAHQDKAEAGVAEHSQQLALAMKQQRVCRKLDALFGLPQMLQSCIDRGAYDQAVTAHNCCSQFLKQYGHMPTFKHISEEVEASMGRVHQAVEQRLQHPGSQVWEAVRDARTLLRLGIDLQRRVAPEYLAGRAAVLRRLLDGCFTSEDSASLANGCISAPSVGEGEGGPAVVAAAASSCGSTSSAAAEAPEEAAAFSSACRRATEVYVHGLREAVEGFYDLQDGSSAADESLVSEFISTQMERLFARIVQRVELRCPPAKTLVASMHEVREALRPLHARLPRLLPKLCTQLLASVANKAMDALFSHAAIDTVLGLSRLHDECLRLESTEDGGLQAVLEAISKTEQGLIMSGLKALTESQPLLGLLEAEQAHFVRRLHGHLASFFLTFVDACHLYVGQDAIEARAAVLQSTWKTALPRLAAPELDALGRRAWRGLFGLILVRIGRHLEVKVISKVWGVAKDMFAPYGAELMPPPAVVRATRAGAQAVITHYTLVAGQRLVQLVRACLRQTAWLDATSEPRDALLLPIVAKELHTWDAQLARILADPRKEYPDRRSLAQFRNSMEREMERLLAKKLQTFAPVPFNRNGVLVGILRIAFKALYEDVREVTFGKYGLQQVQVDCAFLTLFVQGFVEGDDAGLLESLLSEALTSSMARCIEPVLMDAALVEALCEEYRRRSSSEAAAAAAAPAPPPAVAEPPPAPSSSSGATTTTSACAVPA